MKAQNPFGSPGATTGLARWRSATGAALLCAAAAAAGNLLGLARTDSTLIWLTAGLAGLLGLRWGAWACLGVAAGTIAGHLLAPVYDWPIAVTAGLLDGGRGLVLGLALRQLVPDFARSDSPGAVTWLVGVASATSVLGTVLLYGAAWAMGRAFHPPFAEWAAERWLAETLGVLAILPVASAWSDEHPWEAAAPSFAGCLAAIVSLVSAWLVWGGLPGVPQDSKLACLPAATTLLAALFLETPWIAALLTLETLAALYGRLVGAGPFAHSPAGNVELQTLLIVTLLGGLVAGAARRQGSTPSPADAEETPFAPRPDPEAAAKRASITDTLRQCVNALPCPAYGKDAELRYVACNQAYVDFAGQPREQILGKTAQEVLPPEEAQRQHQHDLRVLETGECAACEAAVVRSGQPDRTILFQHAPVRDASAPETGVLGLQIDVAPSGKDIPLAEESEATCRSLVESLPLAVFRLDRDGRFTFVNARYCEWMGVAQDALLGRLGTEVLPESLTNGQREIDQEVIRTGVPREDTLRLAGNSGQPTRWLRLLRAPWRAPDGSVGGLQGIAWEVTSQADLENRLRQSEEHYRHLFETMTHGVVYQDASGRIVDHNPAARAILGLNAEDLADRSSSDPRWQAIKEDGAPFPGSEHPAMQALHSGKPVLGVVMGVFNRVENRRRWVVINAVPLLSQGNPTPQAVYTTFADITELKHIQERLEASQAMLQAAIESFPFEFWACDTEGRCLVQNTSSVRRWGALVGKRVAEIDAPDAVRRRWQELQQRAFAGELICGQASYLQAGQWVHVQEVFSPISSGGRALGILGVTLDITEQKEAEARLRESEARLILSQAIGKVGSWELDLASGALTWSAETYRIFGLDPAVMVPNREDFYTLVHPADREAVRSAMRAALEGQGVYDIDHRIVLRDGKERTVHEQARLVGNAGSQAQRLAGTVQDITDRKQLETRLQQAQKMEAIGQLAGGVAHDFNNILTVLKGHLGMLIETPNLAKPLGDSLREMEVAASRASNLTRQLLAFSRQQVMRPQRLDLNEIIGNIVKMLNRLLGEHIILECLHAPGLPQVEADQGMVEQVLLNLAVNARDAMSSGGRLTIATRSELLTADHVRLNPEARPGRFVVMEVTDTGSGMSEMVLARLFEPFFTTKEVGQGTGLGLATVYGIVKQHQGWIEVDSQLGHGSTFRVHLPAAAAAPEVALPPTKAEAVRGGHETVLVVEDELQVRLLAKVCLRRYGYHVIEAANGVAALQVWDQHDGAIDLLLTDMVMPEGISGRQLAEELLRRKPTLRVIYSSGYSMETTGGGLKLTAELNFLPKPYEPIVLARTVRKCLDAAQDSDPAPAPEP